LGIDELKICYYFWNMEKICLTEDEILETPNNMELGEKVRRKLWKEKETINTKQDENNQESEDGGN